MANSVTPSTPFTVSTPVARFVPRDIPSAGPKKPDWKKAAGESTLALFEQRTLYRPHHEAPALATRGRPTFNFWSFRICVLDFPRQAASAPSTPNRRYIISVTSLLRPGAALPTRTPDTVEKPAAAADVTVLNTPPPPSVTVEYTPPPPVEEVIVIVVPPASHSSHGVGVEVVQLVVVV